VKLRWSKDALRDLIDIRAYIREDAPSRADKLIRELIASAVRLEEFPYSGRAVPEYDEHDRYRELIVGSYRIIYRLESSTVDVLTVFHGSRILPGEPPSFE
jgi:addiction module RelE/StbE family toxin